MRAEFLLFHALSGRDILIGLDHIVTIEAEPETEYDKAHCAVLLDNRSVVRVTDTMAQIVTAIAKMRGVA